MNKFGKVSFIYDVRKNSVNFGNPPPPPPTNPFPSIHKHPILFYTHPTLGRL